MKDGDNKATIQSVDRAIMVLRCFDNEEKLGVTEISKKLGLHKSTTFGLVNTLASNGFLQQDGETGKYQLGLELFRISSNVRIGLREVGTAHVRRIMERTGETANLVLPNGSDVIYIEKKESPHSMRICTSIGQRMPMFCTAVGKAILAFMTSAEQESLLSGAKLERLTENTIISIDELKDQLLRIRKTGYATDFEELEYGLVCIAVPVLDGGGKPVAAFSVSGPKQRMTREKIAEYYPVLLHHSRELSGQMFR